MIHNTLQLTVLYIYLSREVKNVPDELILQWMAIKYDMIVGNVVNKPADVVCLPVCDIIG